MLHRSIRRGGILSASYDQERRTLDIEFDTHRIVRYEDVGNEIADRFLTSAAPVSYFHDEIEDEYSCSELSVKTLNSPTKDASRKKGIPDELRRLFGEP